MILTPFYMVILSRNLRPVCLFRAPNHEDIWGSGGTAPRITSATEAEGVQHHAPAALHPKERVPGTRWIGEWVGPRRQWRCGEEMRPSEI